MKSINQRIGSQIKELRKNSGLTQEEIAEKTGITPAHFNRIERAHQTPSIDVLERISDILEVDICCFFIPEISLENEEFHSIFLKELVLLLKDRPKEDIKLIIEISRMICKETDKLRKMKDKS
ncbi:MAG: helix-turn-helix domain-containing protein [Vulcanimicrobiota bacterium]